METIKSSHDLMKYISKMDQHNSVLQFTIPGKGKFTLVLQEETEQSIQDDVERNPNLERMIKESERDYENGKGMYTTDFLGSFSVKDFK